MTVSSPEFRPTELDLALAQDPLAEALHRDLRDASHPSAVARPEQAEADEPSSAEVPDGGQASREGQRETAAASLAGGMIAAEGHTVTPAEAVQKVHAVKDELAKDEPHHEARND